MKKLALILSLYFVTLCSWAQNNGKCGDNLTWRYDKTTQTLTISGTGEMYNYNKTPWDYEYSSSIIKVVIEFGVTSIGISINAQA